MKKNKIIRKIDNYINDKKFSIVYKNRSLNVINYTKIIDFTDSLISVEYKENYYYIEGDKLVISKMMEDEILITGNIKKITLI